MKVAIFTSFYNYLETFDDLVESIFSQTYENWEWIVSDDFSEDPRVSTKLDFLCQSRPDKVKRIDPSFKKEFYWNPPISHTDAEIFMVFDSDDIMFPSLLEAYVKNFQKFENVVLISSNSEIRNGNAFGNLRAVRYINYGKNCNSYQSFKDPSYEYNWGDARAWRRKAVERFCKPNEWKFCAEDTLKVTVCEEKGEILYLPRVLSSYAFRENSISHAPQQDFALLNESNQMFEKAHQRKDRNRLCSISDYFDRAFSQTTPFYYSSLNKDVDCVVEVFSPSITPREELLLKELFFDHTLVVNPSTSSSQASRYCVVKLTSSEDVELFAKHIRERSLPTKQMVVQAEKELKNETEALLYTLGKPWWWQIYYHYTAIIDIIQ